TRLLAQRRRRQLVKPASAALDGVRVLGYLSVRAEELHPLGDARVVRADEPGIAVGGEVLHHAQAERARDAERSDAPAVEHRAVRVRAVLDEPEIACARQLEDGCEVDGQAV